MKLDSKEFELPDTVFIWDIEGRVFQAIALQCLSQIEGIAPIEGNWIDTFFGREGIERFRGIHVEQDEKQHTVNVKVEVNIVYGLSLPEKADEIQTKMAEIISRLTGLHVGCVHVVFKNLIDPSKPHGDEGDERLGFTEEF